MKVTDTHRSAAEHFDYLDAEVETVTGHDESTVFDRDEDEHLAELAGSARGARVAPPGLRSA